MYVKFFAKMPALNVCAWAAAAMLDHPSRRRQQQTQPSSANKKLGRVIKGEFFMEAPDKNFINEFDSPEQSKRMFWWAGPSRGAFWKFSDGAESRRKMLSLIFMQFTLIVIYISFPA